MNHTLQINRKIWAVLCLVSLSVYCFLSGCSTNSDQPDPKKKNDSTKKTNQTISYSSVTIPVDKTSKGIFVYNPVDHVLTQINKTGHTYTSSTWQPDKGWTTDVESWTTKKNETLENFTFNTNGALYACHKSRKKGKLIRQTLVRLRSKGRIQKVRLTNLNHLTSSSSDEIPEIMDLQCCGTSIAITYQYGTVKIYNLAEGQALGAAAITGTPGKNIFYDLHYITIQLPKDTKDILLRDYDIRSGEITHSFPLGGADQSEASFHVSSYQNNLYILTDRGLFGGHCSDASLTQLLSYGDLKMPDQSRITYLQAGRDDTLFMGCQTKDGEFILRLITIPETVTRNFSTKKKKSTAAPI